MVIASKPNNDRHFLSFSRKLFLSVISLFLVFAACFIAYQYQREKEYKVELLDTQLQDYNERLQQELCAGTVHDAAGYPDDHPDGARLPHGRCAAGEELSVRPLHWSDEPQPAGYRQAADHGL